MKQAIYSLVEVGKINNQTYNSVYARLYDAKRLESSLNLFRFRGHNRNTCSSLHNIKSLCIVTSQEQPVENASHACSQL